MSALDGVRVLFIDLQEGLVETARTQTTAELRCGARGLLEIAQALAWPVRTSVIPGGPAGPPPLIAELAGLQTGPPRHGFGALDEPDLANWMREAGPGGLILAGIATEGAVLATALEARSLGLPVHVTLDACAGLSRRTEEAAIRQIEKMGGISTSVVGLAAVAGLDFRTPLGAIAMMALRRLLPT